MDQQPPSQEVQELTNKLVNAQSRSFEILSNLTGERDEARTQTTNMNQILTQVVGVLGLEAPSVDAMLAEISRLKELDIKKKAKK
jgi:hypothetical protein